MKKILLPLLVLAANLSFGQTFFTRADAFMKKNVTAAGLVDYAGIKTSRGELDGLVKEISAFPLLTSDKATQKAFSINAYNILTIQNVVDHYPVAKPTDVPGFFDQKTFTIASVSMTLSDLENKNIRPVFKDPRMHFALVCAGMGCPPLLNAAYTPADVETQLESRARLALNDVNWIKVNDKTKTVQVSQILDWYKDDFLAVNKTIIGYINQYRTTPIPATYTMSFYTYNWSLNKK